VPVAIAGALVLGAAAMTVLTATAHPVARPPVSLPTARATAPVRPGAPRATPSRKPAAQPPPQAVRTYSAPPDGIPVSGRVLDANGRPVAGAGVTMTRHEGFFEGFAHALAAIGTLGLACLAPDVCTLPYGEAVTDDAGRYTVFLKTDVDDYDVLVGRGAESFTVKVDFAGKPLRLPDVVWWSTAPRLERSGGTGRVRFRHAPAGVGTVERYDAKITGPEEHPPLLDLTSTLAGGSFDLRRIEDVQGRLWVSATVRTKLGKATYSAYVPVSGAARPMSRGKTCVEYGNARTIRNRSCALTDGDLVNEWHGASYSTVCKSGGTESCEQSVAVDLDAPRAIHYVSVQGCDTFFDQVQASVDGRTWRTLIPKGGSSEGCYAAVSGTARYVRVTGAFYSSRREIAVF
jgi:hypothetical protein